MERNDMTARWEDRFFARDEGSDVTLEGVSWRDLFRALGRAGWREDDAFWATGLQVSRYLRGSGDDGRVEELLVILYLERDARLCGAEAVVVRQVAELREVLAGIGPEEVLYAGASRREPVPLEVEEEYAVVFCLAALGQIREVRAIARELSGRSTAEVVAMAQAEGMRLRVGALAMWRARELVKAAEEAGITAFIVDEEDATPGRISMKTGDEG